jgi:DEAD/DEAH box helicase domain-containing protein
VEGEEGAMTIEQAFVPTVYLYDNFPGGVGLSEPLWMRQDELVQRAGELVQRCDCKAGCPACVGPVLAAHEQGDGESPKTLALKVLSLLSELEADVRDEADADVVEVFAPLHGALPADQRALDDDRTALDALA